MINEESDINEEFADMAEAIAKVAELGEVLQKSRLKQRAVILLIQDLTNVRKGDIELILDALPKLKGYLK